MCLNGGGEVGNSVSMFARKGLKLPFFEGGGRKNSTSQTLSCAARVNRILDILERVTCGGNGDGLRKCTHTMMTTSWPEKREIYLHDFEGGGGFIFVLLHRTNSGLNLVFWNSSVCLAALMFMKEVLAKGGNGSIEECIWEHCE